MSKPIHKQLIFTPPACICSRQQRQFNQPSKRCPALHPQKSDGGVIQEDKTLLIFEHKLWAGLPPSTRTENLETEMGAIITAKSKFLKEFCEPINGDTLPLPSINDFQSIGRLHRDPAKIIVRVLKNRKMFTRYPRKLKKILKRTGRYISPKQNPWARIQVRTPAMRVKWIA